MWEQHQPLSSEHDATRFEGGEFLDFRSGNNLTSLEEVRARRAAEEMAVTHAPERPRTAAERIGTVSSLVVYFRKSMVAESESSQEKDVAA